MPAPQGTEQGRPGDGRGEGASGGELNAAVAREVVRLHHDAMGRGPTKARSFYRDNILVVVLEEVLTKGERMLAARGDSDAVYEVREAFQSSLRDAFVAMVEALTGRAVVAYMSSNNIEPDMAAEIFVLDRPIAAEPVRRFARGA